MTFHTSDDAATGPKVHRLARPGQTFNPIGLDLSEIVDDDAPWRGDAICAQVDADMFFPEKGGTTKEAKKVCALCPVTDDCLAYALENDERFGVWGGKSERERRVLSRQQPRPAKTAHCRGCDQPYTVNRMGPPTLYCSRVCREAAAERRTA